MNRAGAELGNRGGPTAVVYGSRPGIGGLGHQISAAISAASMDGGEVFALGPGPRSTPWSLPGGEPRASWFEPAAAIPSWVTNYTWMRFRPGQIGLLHDRRLGHWAAEQLERLRPDACYLFTQVALESLRWCRREGIPTVLDNPNGHIRNFQEICSKECRRWFGKKFHGQPAPAMVERVEEEYELADRIRVSSNWSKACMVRCGVPEEKIHVLHQSLNLERFCPPPVRPSQDGPLQVCYAGSLDVRKGFVYLLRAIRLLGPGKVRLKIVGATGDRDSAKLLARERVGLDIDVAPGDPVTAYQTSEVVVHPSLEDGLAFAVIEGMACGLPALVTVETGAKECVRPGETGWVVPAADEEALAAALEDALRRRGELGSMGQKARADVERYAGTSQLRTLSDWFHSHARAGVYS